MKKKWAGLRHEDYTAIPAYHVKKTQKTMGLKLLKSNLIKK